MSHPTTIRLVIVGFGTVGRGLTEILRDHGERLERAYGVRFRITGVATRRGVRYDPAGLDPAQLLADDPALAAARRDWAPAELIAQAEADALVEVSPTDLLTGEPATGYIRAAFDRGLHVITANKGPIALHGPELRALARARGLSLGYEATVMAGTPALRLAWSGLGGCELRTARGILNGTTNYILTQMDAGRSYGEALAEAQRLGYAETDPTGDVEGHDAAAKAVIVANMLFDARLRLADVARQGITGLTVEDVAAARAAGERWKLIARVVREGDLVTASVRPERLPLSHPLAGVSGATNALTYTTGLLGEVTIIGPGAGGVATGSGLLADLLALPCNNGQRAAGDG
jgi:homoserine dehydrogenase